MSGGTRWGDARHLVHLEQLNERVVAAVRRVLTDPELYLEAEQHERIVALLAEEFGAIIDDAGADT